MSFCVFSNQDTVLLIRILSLIQNITCRECQIRKRSPKTTVEGSKVFVLWEHTYHFFSTKSLLNKRLEIRVTPAAEIKDRVKHTPSAFEMQITVWLSTVSRALYLSWVQWGEYEIVFEYSPNGVLPFVGRVWKSFWGGAACHPYTLRRVCSADGDGGIDISEDKSNHLLIKPSTSRLLFSVGAGGHLWHWPVIYEHGNQGVDEGNVLCRLKAPC